MVDILCTIFQASLDQETIPHAWKKTFILPIFKKGDRHKPANYRPISLTSICCKILEHIVHSHVMSHLDTRQMLNDAQHGFRKSRSYESQLIQTVQDLANSLNEEEQIDAVLLDFSMAFDKVPHQHLLGKLQHCWVRGNFNRWTADFLTDRQQEVVLEGVHSKATEVISGVPQGTVIVIPCLHKRHAFKRSLPPPGYSQMIPLSTESFARRKIRPYSRKILTSYRSGKGTGSCSLTSTSARL